MSILVPFNGSSYIIPTPNEIGWGTNLDNYLVAIANGTLQNIGGSFTLSNDADFGGTNGLKALYYKTRSSNIAASGQFRLANNGDSVSWRNAANSADLPLAVNAFDQLTFNGTPVAVGGSGTVLTGTINTLAYYPASTNTVGSLPAITATRALQSDSNGLPVASSVTSTELGFVSGVTSAIQTQLNTKKAIATGNAFRFETTDGSGNLQETAVTASRAVVTDSNGLPTASVTTSTELAFVSGVTSAIQTQLNAKASTALSNLASVAINTTLVSDTDNTDDLGTSSINWKDIYLKGDVKVGSTTAIDFSSSGAAFIRGTTTNDDAATGFVGEYISSSFGTTNFPSTGVIGDATSISLTAGDWDVTISGNAFRSGSTWTRAVIFVTTFPGNDATGVVSGFNQMEGQWASSATTPATVPFCVSSVRFSLASTTTVYFKYVADYSAGGPPVLLGGMKARRVR